MNQQEFTLGELVDEYPSAAAIFQKRGLDFCCGGKQTLKSACAKKGIEPESILAQISQIPSQKVENDWRDCPLTELIDHIEGHYHFRLRKALPELISLSRKVEKVHRSNPLFPIGISAYLASIDFAVIHHLEKEENILFPMIRAGMGNEAGMPIRAMSQEHEDHGKNLQKLRQMTNEFSVPREACVSWRLLMKKLREFELELMQHIHLENNILFPRALNE